MSNRLNPREAVRFLTLALPQMLTIQQTRLNNPDFGLADFQKEAPSWPYLVKEANRAISALEDHSHTVPSIITDIVSEGPDYFAMMGRQVKGTNLSAALERRQQHLVAALNSLHKSVEGTDTEDESVHVKKKAANQNQRPPGVNSRMVDTLPKEPESANWSARQWATYLSCGVATVHATETWKRLMVIRDKAGWDRREPGRGKRVNKKPRSLDED